MAKNKGGNPRIRCPLCGMWTWTSWLKKYHPVEVMVQFVKGGRAKKDWVKFYPMNDPKQLNDVRKFLAKRCLEVAEILGAKPEVKVIEYPHEARYRAEVSYSSTPVYSRDVESHMEVVYE